MAKGSAARPVRRGRVPQRILAGIRLVNGGLALFAPEVLAGRLGVGLATSPGLGYAFRLFGVRTILLGVELWRAPLEPGNPVIRQALLVHAADTAAATVVYRRHELPPRAARTTIAISAVNTVLAIVLDWRVRGPRP